MSDALWTGLSLLNALGIWLGVYKIDQLVQELCELKVHIIQRPPEPRPDVRELLREHLAAEDQRQEALRQWIDTRLHERGQSSGDVSE